MRRIEEYKLTDNPIVYKKLRREFTLKCPFCPPNKGCNRKRGQFKHRSWKAKSKRNSQHRRINEELS